MIHRKCQYGTPQWFISSSRKYFLSIQNYNLYVIIHVQLFLWLAKGHHSTQQSLRQLSKSTLLLLDNKSCWPQPSPGQAYCMGSLFSSLPWGTMFNAISQNLLCWIHFGNNKDVFAFYIIFPTLRWHILLMSFLMKGHFYTSQSILWLLMAWVSVAIISTGYTGIFQALALARLTLDAKSN